MIRVTGGEYRGRVIETVTSNDIRPTTGRVRESFFSQMQQEIPGCRFLDLYAGSGLMGIEALSRGAAYVLAVEKAPAHAKLIQKNYDKLGIARDQARVVTQDIESWLKKNTESENNDSFDVIYMDPPYRDTEIGSVVSALIASSVIADNGLLIVEHYPTANLPEPASQRRYGDTHLSFFRPVSPQV